MRASADVTWQVVIAAARVPPEIAREVTHALPDPVHWPLARRWQRAALNPSGVAPGSASDSIEATHLHWLWCRFGGTGAPVSAPYAWQALHLTRDPAAAAELAADRSQRAAQVWFCQPAHYAFARDHMVLTSLAADRPSPAEADALSVTARAPLAAIGARLWRPPGPAGSHLWFLLTERALQIEAISFPFALGRSVVEVAPEGGDAPLWRRALNEIQIEWHNHPVNEARRAAGRPEINALWLHGGGVWQSLPRTEISSVVDGADVGSWEKQTQADNDLQAALRGWALAAGVAPTRLLGFGQTPPADGNAITLFDDLCEAHAFCHWGAWLECWNGLGARIDDLCHRALIAGFAVELILCGRSSLRRVVLRGADRWRFWRRLDLRTLLAEEDS